MSKYSVILCLTLGSWISLMIAKKVMLETETLAASRSMAAAAARNMDENIARRVQKLDPAEIKVCTYACVQEL